MAEKILLHSCCAPCSSAILEWLLNNGYEPTVFFFNPNIFPQEEYMVRKNECVRYCEKLGVSFVDGDYDHAFWRETVKGLEDEPERGARCRQCFGLRMRATAKVAQKLGIEHFTTSQEAAGSVKIRFVKPRTKPPRFSLAPPIGIKTGEKGDCRSAAKRSSRASSSTTSSGAAVNSRWDTY